MLLRQILKSAHSVLGEVQKVLEDGNTDLSLDEMLVKSDVSHDDEYTKALYTSARQRQCCGTEKRACNVNNYNGYACG